MPKEASIKKLKVQQLLEDPEEFVALIGGLDDFTLPNGNTPQSPLDSGKRGQIRWDNNYVYLCVADNTWMRSELHTWSPEQQDLTNIR